MDRNLGGVRFVAWILANARDEFHIAVWTATTESRTPKFAAVAMQSHDF
jgi:hypothetical protein